MGGSWSSTQSTDMMDSKAQRKLQPFKFDQFPTGAIKPSGWLRDELQLSADGLGGHLYDFYRFVKKSAWLGGDSEYSLLNESSPYWFNYIVPLAWTLDDQRLKNQAREYLDHVLDNQHKDGWLGPEKTRQTRGIWARSLLLFGLTQYAEADPTQEKRIVDAMHRFIELVHTMLKDNYTGLLPDESKGDKFDPGNFGVARSHELPMSLMWLYEKHPRKNGFLILETINFMFEGGQKGGCDWTAFFTEGTFPEGGVSGSAMSSFTHGVNLAQGLRYPTALYSFSGDKNLVQKAHDAVEMTAKYQTSLSGTIVGDEHLGGLSPQRGSELCMAVESMFSYAYLYRFYGINDYADRAERAAFNAFPAGVSPDWWSRQYVTQTNQPWARKLEGKNPFSNVNLHGITYGLESDFPCCTVNHAQGFPKYVTNSYVRNGETGIAHVLLGPTSLKTTLKDKEVSINCVTRYPFGTVLNYEIHSKTAFDFAIRIPRWTTAAASMTLNSNAPEALSTDSSALHHIAIAAGTTIVSISLPMEVSVVTREGSVGIYHGPLLYATDIAYKETTHKALDYGGWNPLPDSETTEKAVDRILEPTTEWRYAIDPISIVVNEPADVDGPLPSPIFERGAPPVSLFVDAYPIDWPIDHDTAALPPVNPKVDPQTKTKLKLVPFGSAKVHIAQFPVANLNS